MGIFSKDDQPVKPVVAEPETPHENVETPEAELDSVEQRNKENNEELGGSDGFFVAEPHRKKGETVAEYNERVPVGSQAVQPGSKLSYLGKPL